MQKITPFLWYNGHVEDAVALYTSVFPNSKVLSTSPMSATVEIEGQQLIIFNGGAHYALTPAASLYVNCDTQGEVDRLWARLARCQVTADFCDFQTETPPIFGAFDYVRRCNHS